MSFKRTRNLREIVVETLSLTTALKTIKEKGAANVTHAKAGKHDVLQTGSDHYILYKLQKKTFQIFQYLTCKSKFLIQLME